jgi:hypothetical protein
VNLQDLIQVGNLLLFPAVAYLVILERRLTKLETMLSILINRPRQTDKEPA